MEIDGVTEESQIRGRIDLWGTGHEKLIIGCQEQRSST